MAYQSGSATSPTDLLQKFAAFLQANGWTQNQSAADGAGWRLHVQRGSVYANFRASLNEASGALFDDFTFAPWTGIALYLGDGYAAGSSWKNQNGGPKNFNAPARTLGAGMVLPLGAISAYHFFADVSGDNVVVVVEKTSGIYTYMGFGTNIDKIGAWTGGPYFFAATNGNRLGNTNTALPGYSLSAGCPGSYGDFGANIYATSFVRCDVDSFTGKWVGLTVSTAGANGYTGKSGASCVPAEILNSSAPSYARYVERLTGTMTGQSLLLPVRWLVSRDSGGNSFIGAIPNVFLSNACVKGFTPAALYAWGSENFRVFPGPSTLPHYGFAVKQV